MANPVDLTSRVDFVPTNSAFRPWDFRVSDIHQGPGVADYESFRVMQRQAGATMDVDIGKTAVGHMQGWVRGSTRNAQGVYRVDNVDNASGTSDLYLSQIAVTVPTANGTNPRIDCVVMRVLDTDHGGASNTLRIEVLQGTATAGATLDNRNGAPSIPASCELLADVLVGTGVTSITSANIRDRRRFPLNGSVPPLLSAIDQVVFQPVSPAPVPRNDIAVGSSYDLTQASQAMFLPRRAKGTTRIRWKYLHGATALTGNYNIAIYDSTARLIVATGSVAITGTAAQVVDRQETIAATDFEPGIYHVHFGIDTTNAGSIIYQSVRAAFSSTVIDLPSARNVAYTFGSGGVTPPSTLLGGSDAGAVFGGTFFTGLPVPIVGLSVG